jgi:hypothetical protein
MEKEWALGRPFTPMPSLVGQWWCWGRVSSSDLGLKPISDLGLLVSFLVFLPHEIFSLEAGLVEISGTALGSLCV